MSRQFKIQSRVEGGKLRRNRQSVTDAIKAFEGKDIEIIIKRKYKQRSLPQNAFYWAVTIPFFQNLFREHWGDILTETETHEVLKSSCNYKEVPNPTTGEITRIPQSTTNLTTAGWLEYEHKMNALAMDFFNTSIPVPNEQTKLNFN